MNAPQRAARYAVNAPSLPHGRVWQDIEDFAATAGVGTGAWERKLPDDTDVLARMTEAGLSATFCVPAVHMVLPSQIDPPARRRTFPLAYSDGSNTLLCRSISPLMRKISAGKRPTRFWRLLQRTGRNRGAS